MGDSVTLQDVGQTTLLYLLEGTCYGGSPLGATWWAVSPQPWIRTTMPLLSPSQGSPCLLQGYHMAGLAHPPMALHGSPP